MAKHKIVPAFTDKDAIDEIDVMLNSTLKTKGKEVLSTLLKGGTRQELTERLEATLGTGEGYIKTYVDTSLGVIGRRRLSDFAGELGLVWYKYIGGLIKTTREFCEEKDGEYFHESEIESWPTAEAPWDGMIDGTNSENIYDYCGGWNCRHQLVPVATSSVPKEYLDRFEEEEVTEEVETDNPAEITVEDEMLADDIFDSLNKYNRWSDEYVEALNTANFASPGTREALIKKLSKETEYIESIMLDGKSQKLPAPDLAVISYGRNAFKDVGAVARGYMRERNLTDLKFAAKTITEMDKSFSTLATESGEDVLYRGVSKSVSKDLVKGTIFADQGFSSTSSRFGVVKEFGSGKDFFKYEGMSKVKALNMNELGYATHTRENEFILPRFMKFKVVDIVPGPEEGSKIYILRQAK